MCVDSSKGVVIKLENGETYTCKDARLIAFVKEAGDYGVSFDYLPIYGEQMQELGNSDWTEGEFAGALLVVITLSIALCLILTSVASL